MNTKMARLEQVDRLLNLVDELPLGHPDRLKFLAYAEEIIAGAVPARPSANGSRRSRPNRLTTSVSSPSPPTSMCRPATIW
jgi:hypothetical protein